MCLRDHLLDQRMAHVVDGLGDILVLHQVDALVEDHLALVVGDVVVFQDVLAQVEVARLDLLLRLFQRLVDPGMDDRLALLQAELGQHAVELVRPEDAHQVVFERQEELGAAGIALTAGTAAQLVVDAAAFMPFGAEHEQAAGRERLLLQARDLFADLRPRAGPCRARPIRDVGKLLADAHVGVAAELNVGAAAGHVGRDRDRARHARLRDDIGLLLVIARVQNREDLGLLAPSSPL